MFINSGTPVDDNDSDKNYDADKNNNPFKIPAIPKRKASEFVIKTELPQKQPEQDQNEDEETGESLNDLNHTLK